jgi:hypothetical protein
MADDNRLSRRNLIAAGGALAGAAMGGGAQAAPPGPSVPADTGAVQGGRVMFPNWRGSGDRPPAPSPAPQPPGQRVGYCVVGLGRLSLDEILPAFGEAKRSRLAAVMSGSPDKAKLVARQYGLPEDAVYGYDEWERLKANPNVQAVYVVTPNGVHRDNVVAAAAAGKQVLCEKPMAVSSDECRAMIAACAKANVKLMIAYRCQYEPHNRAVIKLARSGEFGKPRVIQAFNGQTTGLPEQWRLRKALSGGGSLPDIGLYCLNTSRAVLGEEPELIQAQIHSPPDAAHGHGVHRSPERLRVRGPAALYRPPRRQERRPGREGFEPQEPVRPGDGSLLPLHPGEPAPAHPRRGGAAGPGADGGDLRSRPHRRARQGRAASRRRLGPRRDPRPGAGGAELRRLRTVAGYPRSAGRSGAAARR